MFCGISGSGEAVAADCADLEGSPLGMEDEEAVFDFRLAVLTGDFPFAAIVMSHVLPAFPGLNFAMELGVAGATEDEASFWGILPGKAPRDVVLMMYLQNSLRTRLGAVAALVVVHVQQSFAESKPLGCMIDLFFL